MRFLAAIGLGTMLVMLGGVSRAWIDPRVLADTANGRNAHFLVVLRSHVEVADVARRAERHEARAQLLVGDLRSTARASQASLVADLRARGARFRPYWIVNAVAVEGRRSLVEALAARPDVERIETNRAFRGASGSHGPLVAARGTGVEWNIAKIHAPEVWQAGDTGQGIVYANADTGVDWTHPALKRQYRGWNETAAAHDYNWWDAVHADIDGNGTNPCGFSAAAPCDDLTGVFHGTHTMGTAIGDDGAGNQIGVAPGARWIACRNMDQGTGRPSTYIECLQFFLAPTDLQGGNPNPALHADVVGNSYDCPPAETCSAGSLQQAVETMRSAGIFMAVSAGNSGPGCSSVQDPPALYDSSVSVGATDMNDQIAGFSGRGPVTTDASNRRKPDVVAPGVGVRSSVAGGGYGAKSGTSMASPHVGATVALLWSAFPALKGNVDATEQVLERSAVPLTTSQGCGGDSPSQVPNNTYGYGRIDALAAYRAAQAPTATTMLTARSVTVAEGTGGRHVATVTVRLSGASEGPVRVSYRTTDGTARAGRDYAGASGTLVFVPGVRERRIAIRIVADRLRERNETFYLTLTLPQNAVLTRTRVAVTIRDDDR